jgi:hypothetical protein
MNEEATQEVDGAFMPEGAEEKASKDTPVVLEFENLADQKELVKKALSVIQPKLRLYKLDRSDIEDVWEANDYMYKCAKNDSTRTAKDTTEDAPMANTGSTMFYRQSVRLAAQTISVLLSKPDPYKYIPMYANGAFLKAEEGRILANQHNTLSRWTRKEDKFEMKAIEGLTMLNKYGNLPCLIRMRTEKGVRKEKVMLRKAPESPDSVPPVVGYRFEDKEYVIANYPSFVFLDNASFYADRAIGDLQKQNVVLIESTSNSSSLYQGQEDGYYMNVDTLTAAELWRGSQDGDLKKEKQENLNLDAMQDTNTGMFWMWDVYARLPIDADGKWDEKKNKPLLYWITFVGDCEAGEPKCIRFQRNPDPDDEIPVVMLHQFPDDSETLYHLSAGEIIKSNFDEQTTAKNQLIDNRTLHNRKPLKAVRGEVYETDLTMHRDKVFSVEKQDSLQEFQFTDITGTIMANVEYLDQDASRALSTVEAIEGVAMGQRTSASEAVNVYKQANMPHMITARYQLGQWLEWYAKKSMRYWHLYAMPEQVVEITGENENTEIKPAVLFGDYEVTVDVVENAEREQIELNALNYALGNLAANPLFANKIDPELFLKDWSELNKLTNPRWIRNMTNVDAERVARLENEAMVFNNTWDEPQPGEDHEAHLRTHKAFEAQFANIENAESLYPGLRLLRQHITNTELLQQQEGQKNMPQGMPNVETPSGNTTPGMVAGNDMAAVIGASEGAMAGRPTSQAEMAAVE